MHIFSVFFIKLKSFLLRTPNAVFRLANNNYYPPNYPNNGILSLVRRKC
jgi:hypothetical protein